MPQPLYYAAKKAHVQSHVILTNVTIIMYVRVCIVLMLLS